MDIAWPGMAEKGRTRELGIPHGRGRMNTESLREYGGWGLTDELKPRSASCGEWWDLLFPSQPVDRFPRPPALCLSDPPARQTRAAYLPYVPDSPSSS